MLYVKSMSNKKKTPSGVSFYFLNQQLPMCSWLWILYAPLGLQNLTLGTPRFTHLCASLHSFKDGSLGIPGLIIYTIDITCYMLAENGFTNIALLSATSYVFLAVDFVRPFGASKSYARN